MQEQEREEPVWVLWWGLQCKNPNCKEDFAARLAGEYPTFDMNTGTVEEIFEVVGEAARVIEDVVRKSAMLNGALTQSGGSVDVTALLQLCPHCRRMYFYAYSNFFLTHEVIPDTR